MNFALPGFKGKIIIAILIISLAFITPTPRAAVSAGENGEEEMRDPFELIYAPEEEEEQEEQEVEKEAPEEEEDYTDPKLAAPDDEVDDFEEIEVDVEEPTPDIFEEEEEDEDEVMKLEEFLERELDKEKETDPAPEGRRNEIMDRFLRREAAEEQEEQEPEEDVDAEKIDEVDLEELLSERAVPADSKTALDPGDLLDELREDEIDLTEPSEETAGEVPESIDRLLPREESDDRVDSTSREEAADVSGLVSQQIFQREMRARSDWPETYQFTFTSENKILSMKLKDIYGVETEDIEMRDEGEFYQYNLTLPGYMAYEMGPDETIEDISRRSGISEYKILQASRVEKDEIETGTVLILPYDI
ncbi:LysM peptidoglycan-binding domain-containing protein [Halarsenatibacter silvermanii]|uniref:LysM domain-containing protein n=1 Tax=Halarsenatibacter silvermanii TaxID=321763 RepID=A0A1G9KRZ9_9FIRM|nr:LysM peptidoglycan-binding domain-containing protein [Halarsenatibacter silvermanii]SDL52237.1 hypothetical protein SAMN04488692_10585 [Halarsenatibacter silvermanii]